MTALNEDQLYPSILRKLSDDDFIHQMEITAGIEHGSTIKMLHFINDLERRKLFLDLGYSSVFDYCVRRIKYSSSQAGRRIQAARCCRRYPEAWGYLRDREVCVMTLAMIEPVITDDNKDEIFRRVRGASRREVERLITEYRPAAALRDRIRYVQVPAPQPRDMNHAIVDRHCARAVPEQYRDRTPTQEKVFVQFLADEEFLQLFEEIRDLMGGSAFESFVDVIKPVLKEYRDRHSPVARHERREAKKGSASPDSHRWEWKNAQSHKETAARVMTGDHPRERSHAQAESRNIPDEVRDEVFVRDGGRCAFVAADGTRCQCTKGLQVDHIKPFANGGTHDPSNLRLLCGAHNRREAERTMGAHVMKQFWRTQ